MVLAHDIHKSFGTIHAVRGISFELAPGQVAALLGPNGAGKTTTIRMIVGFLMPDRGKVVIEGHDTAASPQAARRMIGYLPESTPLYQEMKVREFLSYRAKLFGISGRANRTAVGTSMDRCWLTGVKNRRIGQLSKGYKQRVGLASALVHGPKVLVLDEPTNGLDPTQIKETHSLVRELASDRTMLLSSHILPEVSLLCDRIIVISGGVVRADGAPAELGKLAGAKQGYIAQSRIQRASDEERFVKIMSNIPFVESVERVAAKRQEGEWVEWQVLAKPGAPDLREAIATAASTSGFLLRELRGQGSNLENSFMQLIEGDIGEQTKGRASS